MRHGRDQKARNAPRTGQVVADTSSFGAKTNTKYTEQAIGIFQMFGSTKMGAQPICSRVLLSTAIDDSLASCEGAVWKMLLSGRRESKDPSHGASYVVVRVNHRSYNAPRQLVRIITKSRGNGRSQRGAVLQSAHHAGPTAATENSESTSRANNAPHAKRKP